MKNIVIIMLLSISSVGVAANPELKGNPDDLRQFLYPSDKIVSIYANAEEKAYSDKATISLVIATNDKNLSASLSKNSKLRESITKQLVDSGINQDNIKNSKFSTSPQYGWIGRKPKSYKVVNRMAVSITEESQLQAIAAVADSNDEIELSDTAFEHTKKNEFENMVKKQALAKVMNQKEFYEKNLGIKLTPVGFRNSNVGHRATRGAMVLEEVIVTAQRKSHSLRETPMSADAFDTNAEPSFDEVLYEAGIYVDFKIEGGSK
jgi:uncharacterized protein YggE